MRWSHEATLAPRFDDVWPQPIAFGASVAVRARIDSGHNVCGNIASLALAIGDGVIALGAGGTGGDFASSGAAYVHVRGADGAWTERSPAPLPVLAPSAGYAIALTTTSVLVGAPDHGTVFEFPLLPNVAGDGAAR